jgi:hypothetical protein
MRRARGRSWHLSQTFWTCKVRQGHRMRGAGAPLGWEELVEPPALTPAYRAHARALSPGRARGSPLAFRAAPPGACPRCSQPAARAGTVAHCSPGHPGRRSALGAWRGPAAICMRSSHKGSRSGAPGGQAPPGPGAILRLGGGNSWLPAPGRPSA